MQTSPRLTMANSVSIQPNRLDEPLTPADVELMEQGMHYPSFPDDNAGYTSVKQEKGKQISVNHIFALGHA